MSDDDERHSPKEARARLLEQALEDTLQLYGGELKSSIEGAQGLLILEGKANILHHRGAESAEEAQRLE